MIRKSMTKKVDRVMRKFEESGLTLNYNKYVIDAKSMI